MPPTQIRTASLPKAIKRQDAGGAPRNHRQAGPLSQESAVPIRSRCAAIDLFPIDLRWNLPAHQPHRPTNRWRSKAAQYTELSARWPSSQAIARQTDSRLHARRDQSITVRPSSGLRRRIGSPANKTQPLDQPAPEPCRFVQKQLSRFNFRRR